MSQKNTLNLVHLDHIPAHTQTARRLLPTTALVLSGYLIVGLEASAVPCFIHHELGLNALFVGSAISAQFVSTLFNRPFAGTFTDRYGPRTTILLGLALCAAAGLVFGLVSSAATHSHLTCWMLIVLSRLLLGIAMSWISTAGTVWGIGRVGSAHTAQVVAWSGVASYGSLALGAPIGLWILDRNGIGSLGFGIAALAISTLLASLILPDSPIPHGMPLQFRDILLRVTPYGVTLALAAAGFGCFLSLVTLFFESRGWSAAALPLTVYGICFVAVRLLLARQINRIGPFPVARISLGLEFSGLLLLALASAPWIALLASGLIGAGFSLIFPALCVEAIASVSARNRASAVSLYTGFIELSLAITTAGAGFLTTKTGFRGAFATAAAFAMVALCATFYLNTFVVHRYREVQKQQSNHA